jgi:hypothetical protein
MIVAACTQAYTWVEGSGNAGDAPLLIPGQDTIGNVGSLDQIDGTLEINGVDLYRITITNPGAFSATTVGGSSLDTQLFLFDANGNGVTFNDDDPVGGTNQSRLTSQFVTTPGVYYIGITHYNRDATGASGQTIWLNQPTNTERQPDGADRPGPLLGWTLEPTPAGSYSIFLTGADVGTQGVPPPPPPLPGIWFEYVDADALPPGQTTAGTGSLDKIVGSLLAATDVDMYAINITDPAHFSASLVGNVNFDSQLFLFNPDGTGVAFNDDEPNGTGTWSALSNQFVTTPGLYYLAVTRWDADANNAVGELWLDEPFDVERAPDGPAQNGRVLLWVGGAGNVGNYAVDLTGCQFATNGPLTVVPATYNVAPGSLVSGTIADVRFSDDIYMSFKPGAIFGGGADPLVVTYNATLPGVPTSLSLVVESRATSGNIRQSMDAYNYSIQDWVTVDNLSPIPTGPQQDAIRTVVLQNPADFVGPGNAVRMRMRFKATRDLFVWPYMAKIDEATWRYQN